MGIPVGKLSLYTACAGVPPNACLPVLLDVGTNNSELLDDPLYLGLHQPRLRGEEYDALVEEFVAAAGELFPGVVIQFEDFANHNAFRLLREISRSHPDVQRRHSGDRGGRAGGNAVRAAGHRRQARRADIAVPGRGRSGDRASPTWSWRRWSRKAWTQARRGGVAGCSTRRGWSSSNAPDLAAHKQPYAHDHAPVGSLLDAVKALRPTAIIGVAAVGGAFTEDVVRTMAALNERPIVFALSNPTSKAECTADAGVSVVGRARALRLRLAVRSGDSGRPNASCRARATIRTSFPASAWASIVSGATPRHRGDVHGGGTYARRAGHAGDLQQGSLYPPLKNIRDVSAHIAAAVADVAYREGLARVPEPADLLEFVTVTDVRTPLCHLRGGLKQRYRHGIRTGKSQER